MCPISTYSRKILESSVVCEKWKVMRGQYNIISLIMSRTIEKRHRKISSFLKTLRDMLNNQPPQFITWGTEQNSFKIRNPSRFSEEVLPKYFKHSNLSSFIRQLNIYDFKKVSSEKYPDQYIYSHPCFDKNNPDLMNNIYRKVHHFHNKNPKSSQDQIDFSSESIENSTTNPKKKLKDEIERLDIQLKELRTCNHLMRDENTQLKLNSSLQKNANVQTSKKFYQMLMKSYEVQSLKYAQIIYQYFIDQKALHGQLNYQRHQQAISYQVNGHSSKQSINGKTKLDSTNYNSTSSGGSHTGRSSYQKGNSGHTSHEKYHKKSDKKNQGLLREQNALKIGNSKNFNSEIQILLPHGKMKPQSKMSYSNQDDSQGSIEEEKMEVDEINSKKYDNPSENQMESEPTRCVIDLKNRRTQQQNDLSRMYRAIVLNPKHLNSATIAFPQHLSLK